MVRAVLIGTLAISLSGCASLGATDTNRDGVTTPHDAGYALNGRPLAMPNDLAELFANERQANEAIEIRQSRRRQAVRVLMRLSDAKCEDYLVGIGTIRNTYGSTLQILASVLSTAGGLVAKGPAANAFSAGSTFSQGASSTLNNTLFGGRDFPLLYTAVRSGRRSQAANIERSVEKGEFNDWTPDSILTFVSAYDRDCGVNYALDRLSVAVQNSTSPDRPAPGGGS